MNYMQNKKELLIIRSVTVVCFLFGVIGTLLSFMANSTSLLFDGLYSLVQSLFILASSRVYRLITKAPDDDYQFGYSAFEPFFIVVRTTVLLTLDFVLFSTSLRSFFSGGYAVEGGYVIVYAIASVLVCLAVWALLQHEAKILSSPLLKAEAVSWLADALISLAVLVAFGFSAFLPDCLANYVDPVVTCLFVIALTPPLIKLIISSTRELLGCAPQEAVQEALEEVTRKSLVGLDFEIMSFSTAKRGRTLFLNMALQVHRDYPVRMLDDYRKKLIKAIRKEWKWLDVDVIFSADPGYLSISMPGPCLKEA